MSSSQGPHPRRPSSRAAVVSLAGAVAAVLGLAAGYVWSPFQAEAEAGPRAAAAARQPVASATPQPEITGLTPVSPEEDLTVRSPDPEPVSPDPAVPPVAEPVTPSASATGRERQDPSAAATPEPGPGTAPSPTVTVRPSTGGLTGNGDALREMCEASEPFDYWGNAELRTLCQDQYGS